MSSHGKVQAGDYVSDKMPSAGIKPGTSRTAVEGVDHSTTSAYKGLATRNAPAKLRLFH